MRTRSQQRSVVVFGVLGLVIMIGNLWRFYDLSHDAFWHAFYLVGGTSCFTRWIETWR